MPRHSDHDLDHDDPRGSQQRDAHPDPRGPGPDPRHSSQVNRERYGREPAEYGQYGMRAEAPGNYGRFGDDHGSGYDRTGYDSAPGVQRGHTPTGTTGVAGYRGSDYGAPTDHASFDEEYRRRELRDHRPRTIPTGVSQTPNGPGWGGSGDPAHAERHIDPDYHQWRAEQMRQMDSEYDEWRKERYQRFSTDFNGWRSERAASKQAQSASPPGGEKPQPGAGPVDSESLSKAPTTKPRNARK